MALDWSFSSNPLGGDLWREERREREEAEEERGPLRLCSWPDDLEGNCILSVEGTEVHVNKTHLSMHSHFFRCLFHGDFKERATNRFEVKDVDPEAFIDMLRVILLPGKKIDETNVESLLYFADRFLLDTLRDECISFLDGLTCKQGPTKISVVVLTQLAFRYRSERLKKRVRLYLFAQKPETFNRRVLRECPRFDELSPEALEWLCNVLAVREQNYYYWFYVDFDCDCQCCGGPRARPPPPPQYTVNGTVFYPTVPNYVPVPVIPVMRIIVPLIFVLVPVVVVPIIVVPVPVVPVMVPVVTWYRQ